MAEFPELLILRHGETEWNRLGRMQGALDSPLTEAGKEQARAQNQLIAGFGAQRFDWYSSPQGRALQTARIAANGHDVEITPDPRLREIEMGEWTGLAREEIRNVSPDLFEKPVEMNWYGRAPGGETLGDLAARIEAFLADLGGPSVIVTHGITSRMMRCVTLKLPQQSFWKLGGGQGVLYRVAGQIYERIDMDGITPQSRPD